MQFVNRLEEWILGILLGVMTLLTFVQVFMRYVLNSGFSWALELTTVVFAFMIFLGASYGVRVGAHIGVDALVKQVPPRLGRAMSIASVVLCIVYACLVFYGSFNYVDKMYSAGIELEDLPIPMWTVRAVLPVGYALLAFRLLEVLVRVLRDRNESLHLADEAADALKLRHDGEEPR
jgi:C4-dicarboxylate transporter, DctQ subunit